MFPWKRSATLLVAPTNEKATEDSKDEENEEVNRTTTRNDEPTQVTGILQELRLKVEETRKTADAVGAKATLVIRKSKVSFG